MVISNSVQNQKYKGALQNRSWAKTDILTKKEVGSGAMEDRGSPGDRSHPPCAHCHNLEKRKNPYTIRGLTMKQV